MQPILITILAVLTILLILKVRKWWKSRITEQDIQDLLDGKKKNNKK